MAIGVIGTKSGMTRVFTEAGESVPVTVIVATPNRITQVKTEATDGYNAVQVTAGQASANHVTRPQAGHFAKAGTEAGRGLWEFRLADAPGEDIKPGAE
ncbi:MAG: 50S ribosomal protein L3, partial [Gammaproteobacteria bacterium]|nr:50S ribosomal protein L3 [Gammaproteobacteria bacterium]